MHECELEKWPVELREAVRESVRNLTDYCIAAVAAERERCAKIAEHYEYRRQDCDETMELIAAAIRNGVTPAPAAPPAE